MAASRLPLRVNSETSAAFPVRRGPTCTGLPCQACAWGQTSQISVLATLLLRDQALLYRVLPGLDTCRLGNLEQAGFQAATAHIEQVGLEEATSNFTR